MKVEIPSPGFQPFTVTFTLETREEALRLRALLNHTTIWSWLEAGGAGANPDVLSAIRTIDVKASIDTKAGAEAHQELVGRLSRGRA